MKVFKISDMLHIIRVRLVSFLVISVIVSIIFFLTFVYAGYSSERKYLEDPAGKKYTATSEVLVSPIVEKRVLISDSAILHSSKVITYGDELILKEYSIIDLVEELGIEGYSRGTATDLKDTFSMNEIIKDTSIVVTRSGNLVKISVTSFNSNFSNDLANFVASKYEEVLDYHSILQKRDLPISDSKLFSEIVTIEPGRIIRTYLAEKEEEIIILKKANVQMIALAPMLGVFIAFFMVWISYFFNTRVYDVSDLAGSGVPFLGWIVLSGKKKFEQLVDTSKDEMVPIVEKLLSVIENSGQKIVGVLSASDNEGKTTIATCLCNSLIASGKKTLLISLVDQKSITNATFFEVDSLAKLEEITQESFNSVLENSNLSILKLKESIFSEMRIKEKAKQVFDKLDESFDYIIVDFPSFYKDRNIFFVLTKYIDCSIIITRAGITKIDEMTYLKEELESLGVKIHGLIINAVVPQLTSKDSEIFRFEKKIEKSRNSGKYLGQRKFTTIGIYKKSLIQ